ncbi:DUF1127 domain-containing protein [Xinfangfangia pollutisoli]|uniref:DUF1127 domain-containing protein n=1 Tax=Xinfangfangia pollutisoli TaxID=2865960 RepID=UPI001CD6B020|nr:DUF1127 domain-containing protein [Xinfangfangia pollutisoli]
MALAFSLLSRIFSALPRAAARRRQRQALLRLDARLLADIGISRAQALAEAALPAWNAPGHWKTPVAPITQTCEIPVGNS